MAGSWQVADESRAGDKTRESLNISPLSTGFLQATSTSAGRHTTSHPDYLVRKRGRSRGESQVGFLECLKSPLWTAESNHPLRSKVLGKYLATPPLGRTLHWYYCPAMTSILSLGRETTWRRYTCSSTPPSPIEAADMMLSAESSHESAKAPRLTSSGSVPSSKSLMSGFTARDTFRRRRVHANPEEKTDGSKNVFSWKLSTLADRCRCCDC